ncbi:class I SAM-dependent methyltransferase [Pseudomonas kairouanensis]|uniref:Class I SAM-dependent methyltransferase n=1 Tax=Pseudomonas kairouanensis TaxID=2293832 RepID=A0A4Z0AUG2_9PSED|nr:class I SAM-dependent methyltransferase [Pseudomonas kairouanensis]TFY90071.1 class I SAM-dependent methyltransferase [Pseudomonas kairouanensis]
MSDHKAPIDFGDGDDKCRLCFGSLEKKFSQVVLLKHEVKYFQCNECGSLQTERPYWLDEAYSNKNLSSLDTGAAQRNMQNMAAVYAISKLFGAKNAMDVGGGDGLLCRLLRDYEINCYVNDKYASPAYAQGFTVPDYAAPDIVLGFEVIEHFASPASDMEMLFKYQSDVILLSTELYTSQLDDWWYLVPDSGQHIFFYSKHSLQILAEKYNYAVLDSGGFILFVKYDVSAFKKILAKCLLKTRVCRVLKVLMGLLPARGVAKDHALQIERIKDGSR